MFPLLKRYRFFIVLLGMISFVVLMLFYHALKPVKTLPVYQPAMVHYELVDSSMQHIKKYHRIADFKLINQNGDTITQEDYRDCIYIADFIFTTCPSICPKMTENMGLLQDKIREDPQIKLLSHSVTPEMDSVPILKAYARAKGVIDAKWNLVTGDKKQIYALARKSYLAVKNDGDGGPFDMIHTENFILVDPLRRIRGFYDGTSPEAMDALLEDIALLKAEFQTP